MKRTLLTTCIGFFGGLIVGAITLGLDQWFRERWESDFSEIAQWVSVAAFVGGSVGAIVGGAFGFLFGLAKSQDGRA